MINLKNYIKCYPNIIDEDACKKIITQKDLKFQRATVGGGKKTSTVRNCYSKPLDKAFDTIIFNCVGTVLSKYKKEFKYLEQGQMDDTGYEHLLYIGSEKGEYKEHTDHFRHAPRVISCSILLNDNYEGGDLTFFGGEYVVSKKVGSAVVFPSNFCFPHSVTPITNGDRHSIVTWLL